jgi:DNA-binding transcriptional ArsR family regulator
MSRKSPSARPSYRQPHAALFAALGDQTRLALVARLVSGQPASIAELTAGSRITRQAVTKHLLVLQNAGIISSVRSGRENRFALNPRSLHAMQNYLDRVSHQWDQALARLKSFVEK